MSTYLAAEQGRMHNQYLYYSFFKMGSELPNTWNNEYPWCKYWITANNGVSRRQLFNEAIKDHDMYQSDNFARLEAALKKIPGMTPQTIEHFKALTTINSRDDINCKLALYGGAHIHFDQLITDVSSCKDTAAVSKVLEKLSAQVYTAALNGAFSKLYNVVNTMNVNRANDPMDVDKKVESAVTNFYNSLVFGTKRQKPLEFPDGPYGFALPQQIYNLALKYENAKDWSSTEIINKLINTELKAVINSPSITRK